jgi:hypothetical protein
VPNRDVPSISSYSSFGRVAELVDFPILTNDVDRELVGAVPESKPDLKRVTFSRLLWLLEVVDGIQDAGTGVISVYLCSMMKSTPFVCRRLNAKIWQTYYLIVGRVENDLSTPNGRLVLGDFG